mgnify:CR=1 FL=1
MTTYRVLVFGSTGTGKTSLCNELTGQEMPANSSARGNTFETHTFGAFEDSGNTFILTDTVGLNESSSGTVPAKEAAEQLVKLLAESRDGFSILMHVFRIPRITDGHDKNYEFFVDELTQGNIPVILVATGCENETPMSAWADANSILFAEGGFDYKEIVATCFSKGGKFERSFGPLRRKSTKAVLDAIVRHGLREPHAIYGTEATGGFNQVLTRIWNRFIDIAGIPKKYRKKLNESGVDLLVRLGVSRSMAEAAAEHLPELLGKGLDVGLPWLLPPPLRPLAPLISDFIKEKFLGKKDKGGKS